MLLFWHRRIYDTTEATLFVVVVLLWEPQNRFLGNFTPILSERGLSRLDNAVFVHLRSIAGFDYITRIASSFVNLWGRDMNLCNRGIIVFMILITPPQHLHVSFGRSLNQVSALFGLIPVRY